MKKALADALENRGYTSLTPVQQAVTKPELAGCDLLVSAQTGSGKTLGFGLVIAPTILGEDEAFTPAALPLALVIAPTRELALQVKRELDWLYALAGAVVTSCVGGMDMRDERRILARGAHIVVATPGRLRDHIMRGSIDLSGLRAVVLDEADEMLDLGFREDLEFILGHAPDDRQTLMFSATVPPAIANLAKNYQTDAIRVVAKSESAQHADIDYQAMNVADRDSENAIINVLRFYEAPNAIVFCNTRTMVNRMTTRLSNRGFSVVALSGELSQSERTHALQAMRDGRARVCVATDVAARGIDLPNLDLVVHAELPSNHETLLHRSGRTGRAGRKGVSVLIVPPKARKKAERILSFAKLRASWAEAPSAEAVGQRDEERMLADPDWLSETPEGLAGTVGKLLASFTSEQIAAAYLRLYQSQHSAPEDLSAADYKPKPRAEFGASVWFSIQGGHDANAEPRKLLPMLCKAGGLTKDDIGAIRVQKTESFVQILETSVSAFLKAIGPKMTVEAGAAIKRLDAPPAGINAPRPGFAGKPRDAKPRGGKPNASGTTKPVDWNDDPTPRNRKPKPGQGDKAGRKGAAPAPHKPKRKPSAAASEGGEGRPAPLKTPRGKPTSKKNKARAKAAAEANAANPATAVGKKPRRKS